MDSFIVYTKHRELFLQLNDEQSGRIFKALLAYTSTGELMSLEPIENIVFTVLRDVVDTNNRRLKEEKENEKKKKVKKQADARWERGEDKEETKMLEQSQTCPSNACDALSVSNNNDTIVCHASADPDKNKTSKTEKEKIMSEWNALGLTRIQKIKTNSQRSKMLNSRIKEYGVTSVIEAIRSVRASPFLMGQNKNSWIITFDWLIKPNNFIKVLEGNYIQPTDKGGGKMKKQFDKMKGW